jgi:hypothetical protein
LRAEATAAYVKPCCTTYCQVLQKECAVGTLQALMMRTLLIDSISLRLTGKRTETGAIQQGRWWVTYCVYFFALYYTQLLNYFLQMNPAMTLYTQARNIHGICQTLQLFYPFLSCSLHCLAARLSFIAIALIVA